MFDSLVVVPVCFDESFKLSLVDGRIVVCFLKSPITRSTTALIGSRSVDGILKGNREYPFGGEFVESNRMIGSRYNKV